jgi:hypothetical protein
MSRNAAAQPTGTHGRESGPGYSKSAHKAAERQRRREQGLKQLEVWLPEQLIAKIDEIKDRGFHSRDAVLMSLIAGTIEERKPARSTDQLALL